MEKIMETILEWAYSTGIKVIISLLIIFITFKIITGVCKKLKKVLEVQEKLDTTLTNTLCYLASIALKGIVIICIIGYLGIETSGLSAVVASLGVCAGLAVNGTLSNLAGGVMILVTRPFSVGDYVAALGYEGVVEKILICNTIIVTVDNKTIYLPNSALSTGTITNYSEKPLRRVDLTFSVGGNDPKVVRETLLEICTKEALVLQDPKPTAPTIDFGAGNGLKLQLRAWCKTGDYWAVYSGLLDAAQAAFDEKGIVVPFTHIDVTMK